MSNLKELVVVSGKGGTGKTSLVAGFSGLFAAKVIADCDVDAANLHLILSPSAIETQPFIGGKKARIDLSRCTGCAICRDVCRFGAITKEYEVMESTCEGCGACFFFCPASAVDFSPQLAGHCYTGKTRQGEVFVYAELLPGQENSGKLVAMVREEARIEATNSRSNLILIDGPPGIGCPVISSVTGTHLALAVTEPTASGIHDLDRILKLALHFQVPSAVVINKCDINPACSDEIKDFCRDHAVPLVGEIPYDRTITEAQRLGQSVLDFAPSSPAAEAIRSAAARIKSLLEEKTS